MLIMLGMGIESINKKNLVVSVLAGMLWALMLLIFTGCFENRSSATDSKNSSKSSTTKDTTPPKVTITSLGRNPSNISPIVFSFYFNEVVEGFTFEDITIAGGGSATASDFKEVSATVYELSVTLPTTSSYASVYVPPGSFTDTVGNANQVDASMNKYYDSIAPTVLLASTTATLTNSTINVVATFSENVNGFSAMDLITLNGSVTAFRANGTTTSTKEGSIYYATITPTIDGPVVVSVPANMAQDSAGNFNTAAATTLTWTYDSIAPSVVITADAATTNANPFTVTFTFTEVISGFNESDISVSNGSASTLTEVSAGVYTASITATSEGSVVVDLSSGRVKDLAGNSSGASAGVLSVLYDSTAPTLILTSSATTPTNTTPIPVTITFSESVSGFESTDVSVTNGSVASLTPATGVGTTFTAMITPTADGAVSVSVNAAVATDSAGNDNASSGGVLTRVYDSIGPAITLTSSAGASTNVSPIPVTITFTEGVYGFTLGDIVVTNGSAGNFQTVSISSYTIDVTPSGEGAVTVSIAGSVAQDAAGNNNTASNVLSRIYDITSPTVVVASIAPINTNVSPIPVTINFSENVSGFVVGDISVTNGNAGNFLSISSSSYTVDITPSGEGAVTVSVLAGLAQDDATNGNLISNVLSRTYDITSPTVAVASTEAARTKNSPIPVTIDFSENVSGFAVGDLSVTNGSAGNFLSVSSSAYTVDITPSGEGAVTVSVLAGMAQDAATNGNLISNVLSRTYDITGPSVVVASTATTRTKTSPIPVTIDFTEDVSGFVVGEVGVTNGSAGNFLSISSSSYTVEITPSGEGAVTVSVLAGVAQDDAINGNLLSNVLTRTYDVTGPDVVVASTATARTKTSPIPVTIDFTEDVSGFAVGDLSVINGSAGNFLSVSSSSYTIEITPSGEGAVTVSVLAGVAQDAATNDNTVSNVLSRTYDITGPDVVVASTAIARTKTSPIPVTIDFTEDVSGFAVGDLSVTNGSAGNFLSVSSSSYTVDITPSGEGAVTVSLLAGVAQDAATNDSLASNVLTRTYDITSPTVVVASAAPTITKTSPIAVTIDFSEDVSGFVVGDVSVTNGSAGNFLSVSSSSYTVDVTPSGEGVVSVSVLADVAQDAATNNNLISNLLSRTYDSIRPSVLLSSGAGNPTYTSPIAVTIDFSEDVSGFVLGDLSVTNGSAGNFIAVSSSSYTVEITPAVNKIVSVNVDADVATDNATNTNTAVAAALTRTYYHYASGALDGNFNTTGIFTDNTSGGSGVNDHDRVRAMTIQSDGKILLAGESWNGSDYDMAVWRLTSAGAFDNGFGGGDGIYTHHSAAAGAGNDHAYGIAIASDGSIVVAGSSINGSGNYDMAVWKLESDGSALINAFDGNGIFTNHGAAGGNGNDEAYALSIQSDDGKIVLAGTSANGTDDDMTLWRLDGSSGALDNTFGGGGTGIYASAFVGDDRARALTIRSSDGKIFVAGEKWNGSDLDMVVRRFTSVGGSETTFGTNLLGDDKGVSILIQSSDGKIVIAGYSYNAGGGGNKDMSVWRYNGDTGVIDGSFGPGGIGYITDAGAAGGTNSDDVANAVFEQGDGRLTIAGASSNAGGNLDLALWRLLSSDGSLDTTFGGGDGIYTHAAAAGGTNANDEAITICVRESDGNWIVGGASVNANSNYDLAVWMLN
ncbi:MAG: hypothetical protein HQK52_01315 [Oligoflexia bacterium]|nr:hypothetical protein [Oligoflexia bacterium]